MSTWQMAAATLAAWNAVVFSLYGIDKAKAKRNSHRIRERTLLFVALLFGAPGALAGMALFRHKTRHVKFTVGVPLLLVLNLLACGAIWWGICFL